MEAGTRAVGYLRVSTSEQGTSGLGLDAQEAAVGAHCEQRQWVLAAIEREIASGAKQKRRPVLEATLSQLASGDVLIVAKADRLARSLSAYVRLIDRARSEGWAIVAADGSVDLTTPHGRAMSAMAAVFGELEAELIGDRTKVALAAAKAKGVQLGRRPAPLPARVGRQMESMRSRGLSLRTIATHLNERDVPAPQGGGWHATSVSRALDRHAVKH
jgi:DNA invertase Pin-like site-specific DNA recombinase